MQSKPIITGILMLFVVISIIALVSKEMSGNIEEPTNPVVNAPAPQADDPVPDNQTDVVPEPPIEPVPELPTDGIIAYYFHGNARCHSCITIESLTDQAIQANFSDNLQNGSLIWRVVNTDKSENEHFTDDYQLYTKSVILAEFRDGSQVRWKNLDRVWRLINNEAGFKEYIHEEITAFLNEG